MARRGGVEVAGWTLDGRPGFDSRLTLTACGPSDGKELKDVFGRPGARVGEGSARLRPLAVHGVGCPAAGQNLETGQLSRHYIAEISLNVIYLLVIFLHPHHVLTVSQCAHFCFITVSNELS